MNITNSNKNCFITLPGNFVGEAFCVSQKFWYRKVFGSEGRRRERVSRVSVVFFRFHSDKKYRRGNVLLLRSFRDSENLMLNTKISRFLEKNLLSHSTGILRRRTLLFHKFLWYRKWKNSWIRGGGEGEKRREYQDSPSNFLCLTV